MDFEEGSPYIEELSEEEKEDRFSSKMLSAKINLVLFVVVLVLAGLLAYEIIGHLALGA